MKLHPAHFLFLSLSLATLCRAEPLQVSGRYPHLAMFNHGGECGTGAVVPWADKLWVITYSPHCPEGSDDKLYEIDAALNRITRPESVGGTPANRMIHRESQQLNIGPYFIDAKGHVRAIPPTKLFGRLTATARHLTDPAHKVYIYDMEGLLYEVDVQSLATKLLFKRPVPGWHGKGGYAGQGRLVLANNGESPAGSVNRFKPFDYFLRPEHTSPEDAGVLADWDGHTWRLIERRQFTDVTSPGGIFGPASQQDPLWAIGWDRRSLMLEVCDAGQWHRYRLAMADYSYVASHGWHTEWPRIREVIGGKYLMNMHGGWFEFPPQFRPGKTGGLRPLGDYLKITGDFCPWNGRIVFGCDDTAKDGFHGSTLGDTLNRLIGQSNSNLWFTTWDSLTQAGQPAGFGGPWLEDNVPADTPSDPFLIAGYAQRCLHLMHRSTEAVRFTLQIDKAGDGHWSDYQSLVLKPGKYAYHILPADLPGQWIRIRTDRNARGVMAYFHLGPGGPAVVDRSPFAAIADVDQPGSWSAAVLRSEGSDWGTLGVLAHAVDATGHVGPAVSYQVDEKLHFTATPPDSKSATFLRDKAGVQDRGLRSDAASIILIEDNQRFRIPHGSDAAEKQLPSGWPRALREIVTERAPLNAGGSLYLVPRTTSGGVRRIKPICTHNKRITDFCSWRGMLVIAGCLAEAQPDGHYFTAEDRQVGLWFGDIDDLWKLGKPVGVGGPWRQAAVHAGERSDPYLMAGYDRKTLELSHDAAGDVRFTVLVDVAADDHWATYTTIRVPAGQTITHRFPPGYSAHWVRLQTDGDCRATATFRYE